MPTLGLGTWQMGGRYERDFANDDARDAAAIKHAIEMGITHIDTAEIYAAGHCEELVRQAIQILDRNRLFFTTKVSGDNLGYDQVIKAAQGSLARLGIKQIDLYLIHWPNYSFSLQETMRAMDFLLENEMTRYIGVSNFVPQEVQEAQSYTKYRIVDNQIHYSLEARGHEEAGTLKYCEQNKILVTAYRPLQKGELAKSPILQDLGKKYGKSPLAVALTWVLNKPNVVALVKTSNPNHLQENLTALGFRLEPEDEKYLDENFPRGKTMGVGVEP